MLSWRFLYSFLDIASKCTIVCKSVVCKSIDTLRPDPWDINFGMSGKQVVNREITQCKVFSYREIDCLGVILQILEETLMLRVLCLALQGFNLGETQILGLGSSPLFACFRLVTFEHRNQKKHCYGGNVDTF